MQSLHPWLIKRRAVQDDSPQWVGLPISEFGDFCLISLKAAGCVEQLIRFSRY